MISINQESGKYLSLGETGKSLHTAAIHAKKMEGKILIQVFSMFYVV